MCNVECVIADVRILTSTISHLTSHIQIPSYNIHQKVIKCVVLASATYFFGDHTVVVTPVPIPNTVVKLPEPMIVPTSAKVGIARFFSPAWAQTQAGLFCALVLSGPPGSSASRSAYCLMNRGGLDRMA